MPDSPNKLAQFWQELKRRRVIHVIIVYATAAFVILEAVDIIFPRLGFPDWTVTFVIILITIGFPLAIIFSWIFDVTPEGIEKTKSSKEIRKDEKSTTPNSWRIATYVSVGVIIGLIALNIFGGKKEARIDESLARSIAVLPFHNLSGDDSQEYICVGLTDEIISHLFKVKSFDEVRSLTSVLPFRDSKQSIKEIAQELQVNYILEGSLKRMGDELKITAQLIEPKNDNHIWLHDYELPYKEIIGIPGEIALQISDHLKAFISGEEKVMIEKIPTNNLEAYEQYLLGKFNYYEDFQNSLEKDIQYFKKAIQLDPDFALAYVYLAHSYQNMARYSLVDPEEVYKETKEATLKAIELDESLGEAYAILGLIKITFDWDIYGPDADFQKAIQLSPNSANVFNSYAQYLRYIGRFDEGIKIAKRAIELNPLSSSSIWLVGAYFWAGEYEEAIQESNELLVRDSSNVSLINYLAWAYTMIGKYSDAIRCADKVLSIVESIYANPYARPRVSSCVGWVYAKTGERDKAEEILSTLHEAYEKGNADPYYLAAVYAGLGETEKAIKFLQKAYESRSGAMIYLYAQADNLYEYQRSDPRFVDILEKIGFKVEWK